MVSPMRYTELSGDYSLRRRSRCGFLHQVDQCRKVHRKLGQYRRDRVQIEDVRQGRLFRQHFERFRAGDEEETGRRQQTVQRQLGVAVLDAVDVQHRLTVRRDQRIQGQNLEHLQRRYQRAAALLDDVAHWREGGLIWYIN